MYRTSSLPLLFFSLVVGCAARGLADDWLTIPAPYTHTVDGTARTHQYQQPAPSVAPAETIATSSGYRHFRSSLQVGRSSDHYHRTEQWGAPVRPYGEWRFPYRPYGVPYQGWGPPFGGLNQFLGGGYGFYPDPRFPRGNPQAPDAFGQRRAPNAGYPVPYPPLPDAGYAIPPYYDGGYPDLPYRPRLDDEQFYARPELN